MITISHIPTGTSQTIRTTWPDDEWEEAWENYEEHVPTSYYIAIHFGLNAVNEEVLIAESFEPDER